MEAYFDNSATTVVTENVKDIVVKVMTQDYGNPSSMHMVGVNAEKYIKQAKENISKILKTDPKEIYFTSGGTESNNLAIIGSANANKRAGNRIITNKSWTFFCCGNDEILRRTGIWDCISTCR